MSEEEVKPTAEEPTEEPPKEEKKKPVKQRRTEDDIKKAEDIEHKSLDDKTAALEKLQKEIDKKRANLKTLIAEAEHHGRSPATGATNQAEERMRLANESMKGTGLKPYPDVE